MSAVIVGNSEIFGSVEPSPATILVVDDESAIRRTLCQILEDEGFRAIVAVDGHDALIKLEQERPDLILLDIWMPGLDGLEVLRRIKELNISTPVLMISGHASISTAVESTKLGAADFIEKPFDLDVLLTAVQSLLAIRPADQESEDEEAKEVTSNVVRIEPSVSSAHTRVVVTNPIAFADQRWAGRRFPQRTLRSSALLYGQGLHTGKKSGLVLEPLPPHHGIHFVGVGDTEAVPAHLDFVRSTGYATTLRAGSVRTGTVEHLLAAFHAYGISNALIKCNGEVPVMDGSSLDFCRLFDQIGVEEQPGAWYEIEIQRTVRVGNDDEWIQIEPADDFTIEYYLRYPQPVGEHRFSYTLGSTAEFTKEIAPARTFSFLSDVGKLQRSGLAQGGRFDNFILIGEDGPLNGELRFEDELVRHKILDVIGDLYLLGRKIRGKVTAHLTGHSDNVSLLEAIRNEMSKDD